MWPAIQVYKLLHSQKRATSLTMGFVIVQLCLSVSESVRILCISAKLWAKTISIQVPRVDEEIPKSIKGIKNLIGLIQSDSIRLYLDTIIEKCPFNYKPNSKKGETFCKGSHFIRFTQFNCLLMAVTQWRHGENKLAWLFKNCWSDSHGQTCQSSEKHPVSSRSVGETAILMSEVRGGDQTV